MSEILIEDRDYRDTNFSEEELARGNYEYCTFNHCTFSDANLSGINFVECTFEHCDFTMANISTTVFRDVKFIGCKMLGLRFEDCNDLLLSMDFDDCQLNLSSFYKLSLKNTNFNGCSLQEVDFTETDLTGATIGNCDLAGAIFKNTVLEKADLRSSYNFSINPEINRIGKAKFSLHTVSGLLDKYDIEIE